MRLFARTCAYQTPTFYVADDDALHLPPSAYYGAGASNIQQPQYQQAYSGYGATGSYY